jgi:hypothetical protein
VETASDRTLTTLVYHVADTPIQAIVEATHVPACNLLTFRFRLLADRTPSQRIGRVRILDLKAPGDRATLRGFNGGFVYDESGKNVAHGVYPPREYAIRDRDLSDGDVELEDLRGRSSVYYTPVWLLQGDDEGVWFGQEWSGSWRMAAGLSDGKARAWIELPFLDFKMVQGEEVQLPPVSIGTYEGSLEEGCVALRRAVYREFMPTINGVKPDPAVGGHAIGGSIPQFTAEGLDREIDVLAGLGLENLVFASCWYRPPTGTETPFSLEELREMFPHTQSKETYEIAAWWEQNGDLRANEDRFPRGLQAFADKLADRGMLLGLWYDPRINVMTETSRNKSDFLAPYKHTDANDRAWDMPLIDMGTEAGRKYMLELLETLVVEHGAAYLWHDLNTDPRTRFWDDLEEPDRRGLRELRHFIGSDGVYDEFMRRHPHVWIEWCGGGGSMVNLGVLRRAHTLMIADYSDIPGSEAQTPNTDITRAQRTSLNHIVPATQITSLFQIPGGVYDRRDGVGMENFLAQFGSAMALNKIVSQWSDRDLADAARAVALFKNVRRYLNEDFWNLLPTGGDRTGWDGWQFHDQVTRGGIFLLFKRSQAQHDTETIRPNWVGDTAPLRLRCLEGEATFEPDGEALRVTMKSQAVLVQYDSIEAAARDRAGWQPTVTP